MKKFAVSFKGGLARGFGGIGVMRFFQEEKLIPTVLGGSSSGAIVASAWAAGYSWDQLLEIGLKSRFTQIISLKSLIKDGSLVSYDKYKKRILDFHKDMDIADLPIKTVIFATDPVKEERVFLEKGSLVEGIIASSGFLPVFPSTCWHGRLLLDGDLSVGYSSAKLKELGAEKVIGVGHKKVISHDAHPNIIGKIGKVYQTLINQIELAHLADEPIDLSITYNPGRYSIIDFKHLTHLTNIAYNHTKSMQKEIFKVLEVT